MLSNFFLIQHSSFASIFEQQVLRHFWSCFKPVPPHLAPGGQAKFLIEKVGVALCVVFCVCGVCVCVCGEWILCIFVLVCVCVCVSE